MKAYNFVLVRNGSKPTNRMRAADVRGDIKADFDILMRVQGQRGHGNGSLLLVSPSQIAMARIETAERPLWQISRDIGKRGQLWLAEVGREDATALLGKESQLMEFIGEPVVLEIPNPKDDGLETPPTKLLAVVVKNTLATSNALRGTLYFNAQDSLVQATTQQALNIAGAMEAEIPDLNTASALAINPAFLQHLNEQGIDGFICCSGKGFGYYSITNKCMEIVDDRQKPIDQACGIVLVSR